MAHDTRGVVDENWTFGPFTEEADDRFNKREVLVGKLFHQKRIRCRPSRIAQTRIGTAPFVAERTIEDDIVRLRVEKLGYLFIPLSWIFRGYKIGLKSQRR